MSLLIKSGRIVDPLQGLNSIADIRLNNSVVDALGVDIEPFPDDQILDASGLVVCPGFIDLHCHLREPGQEIKETVATGTTAAAKGGFTTVCAMPNTIPPIDHAGLVGWLQDIIRKEALVKVLPIACVTLGRSGTALVDMRRLSDAGVIGFSDDGSPVWDDDLMRMALTSANQLGLPVINHCEDLQISMTGVMNEGPVADMLGLPGISTSAETNMVSRDIEIAELTGAWLHLAHMSTSGSVDLVRKAKDRGVSITAEVTPHHLTITDEWAITGDSPGSSYRSQSYHGYNTNAKVNPPLRSRDDVEALIEGLKDGTIDCVATDHAPHTFSDKRVEFREAAMGISGLETALGSLMGLVHSGRIDLSTLIRRLTVGPSNILKRPKEFPASLKIGVPADVTVLDLGRKWVVDSNNFSSKGKNTPIDGSLLTGKVVATLVDGRLIYRDEAVKFV